MKQYACMTTLQEHNWVSIWLIKYTTVLLIPGPLTGPLMEDQHYWV